MYRYEYLRKEAIILIGLFAVAIFSNKFIYFAKPVKQAN
jgi:hypothetical protein